MADRDDHERLPQGREAAAGEDVKLRLTVARSRAYETAVESDHPLEVIVQSPEQPPVRVTPGAADGWCTCDEDTVVGTCSHVLYLASGADPVGERVRAALADELDETTAAIEDLEYELQAKEVAREALASALRLCRTFAEE